jgi:hypothetical protein
MSTEPRRYGAGVLPATARPADVPASPVPAPRGLRPTLAGAALVGSGCVAIALVDPAGGPPLCPFRAATGLDCPLCGATRAAHHLFRGDVIGALGYNALFVVIAPLLLAGAFLVARQAFGGPVVRMPRPSRRTVLMVLTVVVVFTVVRNVGVAPFDWLSTTA